MILRKIQIDCEMKFKKIILFISVLFIQKGVFADGCNSGAFNTFTNCNTPLTVCFDPGGTSDQPPDTDYTWDWGDGTTTLIHGSNAQVCHTYAALGTYTVTLTLDVDLGFFGGHKICVTSTVINLVATPPPVLTITNPASVCDPGTIDITGAAITAGSTGGGTLSYWMDAATTIPLLTPSAITVAGTYYIKSTIAAGCSDIKPVVVAFYPPPVITVTDPPGVCTPGTVDVTAASVTAGSTGTGVLTYWSDIGATVPIASPNAIGTSGTYYIKMVTTAGGCIDIKPVVVTIIPLPISDAGPDITICTGSTGTIGSVLVVGNTYSWNPATGLTTSTDANPTVTLTNAGPAPATTAYTVTTTALGCTSTDVVNVTVNALATANAGSGQTVCPGAGFTLGGSVGGTATSGTWSGGTGTYSPNNTTLNAVYHPSPAEYAADSVKLTLTTNDPAGPCTFASSDVVFHFYKKPVVFFTVDDPDACPPHCVHFYDSTTVGFGAQIVSWNWTFGDNSSTSALPNPSHCYNLTGYYDVTLITVSNQGCSDTLLIPQFIHVFPVPIAEFTPSPSSASIIDPTIEFQNQSSADVTYWHWNFGDSTTLAPNTASPVHLYSNVASSTYMITLIVHNSDGCYDTVSHPVEIGPEFTFFIPNAFTPNGDSINDFFFGSGIGIIKYDLWIFDRWGNMIFHGRDLNEKWDGKANGGDNMAQIDVYVWKVELTDVFEKKHFYIGTVTLVK